MDTPPTLPGSTRPGYRNGSSSPPQPSVPSAGARPSFLAPFFGAFAAVLFLAVIVAAIYFGAGLLHSSSGAGAKAKSPLANAAVWQLGTQTAKPLDNSDKPDIGWWTSTFDLPPTSVASDYLKGQGLTIGSVVPLHYQDTPDATTMTYKVDATVPNQLLRLHQTAWQPSDPVMARYSRVLVLNEGLPPGTMWDTQNATVAADAGTELNFVWQVTWDKKFNTVTTDHLPFDSGVFTQQQVAQYQAQSSQAINALQSQIQQIDSQVQADEQSRLAQVPADPPKPELLSRKWGGDGSGEPTKSAERIGGGTAAGAAGGAIFGGVAGDAGLGAGIGAGVGLLGGIIYDTVSKNNDKKKYQEEVDDENASRLHDWHAQIKALNQQRSQIKQDAVTEREKALTDLANRIAADQGRVDNAAPSISTSDAPVPSPTSAPPLPSQPTADQPSGPIHQP